MVLYSLLENELLNLSLIQLRHIAFIIQILHALNSAKVILMREHISSELLLIFNLEHPAIGRGTSEQDSFADILLINHRRVNFNSVFFENILLVLFLIPLLFSVPESLDSEREHLSTSCPHDVHSLAVSDGVNEHLLPLGFEGLSPKGLRRHNLGVILVMTVILTYQRALCGLQFYDVEQVIHLLAFLLLHKFIVVLRVSSFSEHNKLIFD